MGGANTAQAMLFSSSYYYACLLYIVYVYPLIPQSIYTIIHIIQHMARITVRIDDDLEKKVRTKIAQQGGKKGDLAKAVEESLNLWLKS